MQKASVCTIEKNQANKQKSTTNWCGNINTDLHKQYYIRLDIGNEDT